MYLDVCVCRNKHFLVKGSRQQDGLRQTEFLSPLPQRGFKVKHEEEKEPILK